MFYAIPLENKPTWRNPPWMTVLLILVNMLVFWGPQRSEEKGQNKAAAFYTQSALPGIEIPRFVAWLEARKSPDAKTAQLLARRGNTLELLAAMESARTFQQRLRADQIITPADPQYAAWKPLRREYEAMQPPAFTLRFAQDHAEGAEFRPVTWVTSAFLHASTGHLLGNMLFLFLFGFSVELALGRGTYLGFYLLGAVGASLLASWAYAGKGSYGLGASGAVSALMGMYAVMYRLKRIRFFYQLFFYFNYVTAPALLLLPAWIVNELMQHFWSGQGIAYMAHLGGLLTGAALMSGARYFGKLHLPEPTPAAPPDRFDAHVANARRLAAAMKFEEASAQWRAAAKLRPDNADTLRAWFNTAKLWPAGEDFHRAAHRIFRLAPYDAATLELQHASYKVYLDQAKPGARLKPDDMAGLARRFTRHRQFNDADKLCTALMKTAPEHAGLGETLGIFVNGLLQAGRREQALSWLPHLQRFAPSDMATRTLSAQRKV